MCGLASYKAQEIHSCIHIPLIHHYPFGKFSMKYSRWSRLDATSLKNSAGVG
jgi:hypothetical protein